ncbi:MAG: zinc ribbon domain-containing protein [Spirochaetaceae bacterium]|jgi:uncharacterized membrane protein YvbJ|nr:zinc ribbon domain-containing protein [Spirochaetaceae bacterium]
MSATEAGTDRKPKFFCDFCGTEVKQNDRMCRKCGKFFSSVKCPACGKTGSAAAFSNGCPACGYAFSNNNSSEDPSNGGSLSEKHHGETESLPLWIYLSALGLTIFLIIVTLLYLR